MVVTAKAKADERVLKIKNKYKALEDQFEEAEKKIQSRDEGRLCFAFTDC